MYRQSGHFNGHWFAKHNSGLTLEDATRLAPALAASSVKPGLTTRYGQVHTSAGVEGLLGQGYLCVGAGQTKSRSEENTVFAKHVLQFSRPEFQGVSIGNDKGDIRVVISNSHDGTGAYIGSLGLFRHARTNSLVVSLGFGCFRVRHHVDTHREVIEATYRILDDIPRLEERVSKFQAAELRQERQVEFAKRAASPKWDESELPFDPTVLLTPRRSTDAGPSVWSVYNRAQENLIKGRIRYHKYMPGELPTRQCTRATLSPLPFVKVNRVLWQAAEEYAAV